MIDLAHEIERSLLPAPDVVHWSKGKLEGAPLNLAQKIYHYTVNVFRFLGSILAIPVMAVYLVFKRLATRSVAEVKEPPLKAEQMPLGNLADVLPDKVGFAGSGLQDSGLGTEANATVRAAGKSQWHGFLTPEHIEGMEGRDFNEFFIDILDNPEPFVAMLKDSGCTAYRVPIEWAAVQPAEGVYDELVLQLYENFFDQLREAGIEPYVTLHHFVHPQWFEEKGAFYTPDNIQLYTDHCLRMMERFPAVKNFYTFNEVGAFVLENLMGDFPTKIKGDMAAAGRMMRNILMAHCKLYEAAKDKYKDTKTIGLTHQWIKFAPVGGNAVEKLVCYLLSKIAHSAVYNFFKTGQFVFDIPGKANIRFSVPEADFKANNGFLDVIGFQRYGLAQIKAGWNDGNVYPGNKVMNYCWKNMGVSFGATCHEGESIMSFGPTVHPQGVRGDLQEAVDLGHDVHVTEIGCDAKLHKWGEKAFRLDEQTQVKTMQRYAPVLGEFQENIKAFFVWTAYASPEMDEPGQMEWNRGAGTRLGMIKIFKDDQRRMTGYEYTPGGALIKVAYNIIRHRAEEVA
ncbi:MAG: family 1 glycosylhydrolase [Verrucomicrobia bacterium]|nr:family 1 glycosylhydrolase [Verrucomicrobiota bacterium]